LEGLNNILQPFLTKRSLGKLRGKLNRAEPKIQSIQLDTIHKDKIFRNLYYDSHTIRIPSWFDRLVPSIQKYSCTVLIRHNILPTNHINPFPSLYVIGSLESIDVANKIITLIILYVRRNSIAVSNQYAKKSKLERQSIRRGKLKPYYRKLILNGHQVRGIYKKILVKEINLLFKELLKDRRKKSYEADFLIRKKLLNLKTKLKGSEWLKLIPLKNSSKIGKKQKLI